MTRALGWVIDPAFEDHDTGPGHAERPDRARAVREAVSRAGLAARYRAMAPVPVSDRDLERVHDVEYIRRVERACASGERVLDSADTAISTASAHVARLAAGSAVALCREVAAGRIAAGFAAVRPPGHHAERDLAMGFCLFNNVVVAARHLQVEQGIARILIVDWDVHHGNGTQHLLEDDPDVLYFSVHQWPLYPGTGARSERGRGPGLGATVNCPLPPGSGDTEFLATLEGDLTSAAEAFRPEFVIVSAGFDAHAADPLGGLRVTTGGYVAATRIVRGIAERHAAGRLVSVLEGGYDLDALGASVVAHLETMAMEAV